MKKLVIIPAYNEEKSILGVIENLRKTSSEYDYIIINDGSKDNTQKICEENNLNYINLPKNLGIGGAMQTGYKYAYYNNYDVAIQIDGDGQHDTSYLDKLLEKLKDGNDIVIGSRYIEKTGFQSSTMRRFGKSIISLWISILCHKKITDPTSGFRMCNAKIIKMFANKYPFDYPEPETIVRLLKNGYRVEEIPVQMKERNSGVSSITPIKSVRYMIKVLFAMFLVKLERKERIRNDN